MPLGKMSLGFFDQLDQIVTQVNFLSFHPAGIRMIMSIDPSLGVIVKADAFNNFLKINGAFGGLSR